MRRRLLPLACLAATLAVAGCGDNEADVASGGTDEPAAGETRSTPAANQPEAQRGGCREVKAPKPNKTGDRKKPRKRLDPDVRYTAVLETSCGTMNVALDTKRFPKTVASFVSLARDDFYDGLTFHRIVPDFVVQGGSPDGSPTGEPGYRVIEAPPETIRYPRGTVAMAKAAAERPGTSGSQFFIVTSNQAQFDPVYAALGRVTEGRDVLDRIADVPTDPAEDYRPTQPVVIDDVRIREQPRER